MYTFAQLASEINTDPKAFNYATPKNAGDDGAVAAIFNATYAGVGIVWRTNLTAKDILSAIVWSEVSGFTNAQVGWLNALLVPLTIDASKATIRAMFGGLFASTATTLANLTAIAKVPSPTRGEELFGAGTLISAQDIAHALGRG